MGILQGRKRPHQEPPVPLRYICVNKSFLNQVTALHKIDLEGSRDMLFNRQCRHYRSNPTLLTSEPCVFWLTLLTQCGRGLRSQMIAIIKITITIAIVVVAGLHFSKVWKMGEDAPPGSSLEEELSIAMDKVLS